MNELDGLRLHMQTSRLLVKDPDPDIGANQGRIAFFDLSPWSLFLLKNSGHSEGGAREVE